MFRILLFSTIFLASLITYSQLPDLNQFKNKKVEYLPVMYELPTTSLTISSTKSSQIWIVYSDRNDNNIYSDINYSKTISKVNFLDSFLVTKISGEMFELIRYKSNIINTSGHIVTPDKIEYVGWINKSNLLLNERSFVDPINKYPYKYATLLNGTKLFPTTLNYLNGSFINVFIDPELKTIRSDFKLNLNEVVYVFKKYKDNILIGKKSKIETKNSKQIIIGWVHTSFIQQWSTRLSIEPKQSEDSDTIHSYLFPAKNLAVNFENNSSAIIPLKSKDCCINEIFGNKNPVYNIESITKNNKSYMLMETGVIIKPFNNSQAYIYSSSGSKINYTTLCSISEESKKTNIVFALNFDEDTKEYYTSLIETFQELDIYFSIKKSGTYSFSLVDLSDNTYSKILTVDNFNQLLPKAIDLIKENVQFKKVASSNGILNGLTTASNYFKNHIAENNIIMLLSTHGDNIIGDVYKNKLEKAIIDLSISNTKMIMYQPYSSNGSGYTNFIPQSKNILKKYADKSISSKSALHISNTEPSYSNTFKAMESGVSNIYCLDFPKNACSQGFIIFPTIGSKVNKKIISNTFDSLFYQIRYDQTNTINNIQSTFNSSSVFNTQINPYFERYYNMFNVLPRNLELECKNVNFNYFADGFTISPYDPLNTKRYYEQSLLLTEDEYQELCTIFKSLRIDILLMEPTENNKQLTENAIQNVFNKRTAITGRKYTQATLKDFLFETSGYYTYTHLLNKCPINYMFNSPYITKDQYFTMFTRLKKSFDLFYQIQDNPNYAFNSNGIKYYWINETILP